MAANPLTSPLGRRAFFGGRPRQRPEQTPAALAKALGQADAVILGAGAGLSASAGFSYTGPRFETYFADFRQTYGFCDMYAGGFYPYPSPEESWAFWSRYIWINRYMDPPKDTYGKLLALVKEQDYFVLTTNVDHCFQKAGFDKHRLFYTQGDYGLWQCSKPCHDRTYDNKETVLDMLLAQGFQVAEDNTLLLPEGTRPAMEIPSALVPKCPVCGEPMTMNLRADDTFVEDEGWHRAAERYSEFLRRHQSMNVLFLELGTGMNTPSIIKYPFWRMALQWPKARFACINLGEAYAPEELRDRSLCFDGDIDEVLQQLREQRP